jgi:hypothetical protein
VTSQTLPRSPPKRQWPSKHFPSHRQNGSGFPNVSPVTAKTAVTSQTFPRSSPKRQWPPKRFLGHSQNGSRLPNTSPDRLSCQASWGSFFAPHFLSASDKTLSRSRGKNRHTPPNRFPDHPCQHRLQRGSGTLTGSRAGAFGPFYLSLPRFPLFPKLLSTKHICILHLYVDASADFRRK